MRIVDSGCVIVGAGIAGLTAALRLAHRDPVLVTKSRFACGGSSPMAAGGVAVAIGDDDAPELHAQDTIQVGVGLNDHAAVRLLTEEGPQRVRELIARGAQFDREPDGDLARGREAAHSRRRILHARDATGAELVRTLAQAVRQQGLRVEEFTTAIELVTEAGRVVGLTGTDAAGEPVFYRSPAVVLATGGLGQLYRYTTNPVESSGDGLAMAARAGARLVDLEFVQFHPTALRADRDPLPLMTEALRGDGARLVDEHGHRFVDELAARDVVARALWFHAAAGHQTLLDMRGIDELEKRFPGAVSMCRAAGYDPLSEPVPVTPAAHYHMGGIEVDADGRSSLPGLWACGEVSATGVHGANRLASNSLLEALVFGTRVGASIDAMGPAPLATVVPEFHPPVELTEAQRTQLREVMWSAVALVRHRERLQWALAVLETLPDHDQVLAARLVTAAALAREESRGAHYREDFPKTLPAWKRHLVFEGMVEGTASKLLVS